MTPAMAKLVASIEASLLVERDFDRCVAHGRNLREAGDALLHLSGVAMTKAARMIGTPMPSIAVAPLVRPS